MAFLHTYTNTLNILKTHCVSYDIWVSELIITRIEHEPEVTFLKDLERLNGRGDKR